MCRFAIKRANIFWQYVFYQSLKSLVPLTGTQLRNVKVVDYITAHITAE